MSLQNILLALVPALCWGIQPIFLTKIGGDDTNSVLGFGLGTVVMGLLVQLTLTPASISLPAFLISFFSGMFWTLGQAGQVKAYRIIGVSKTMPISTGFQLVGTSLIGLLAFGEWSSWTSKVFGFLAIAILVGGAYLTSVEPQKVGEDNGALLRGLRLLLLTSVGYWVYSAAPRLVDADALSIFLPEMLGILTGAVIYAALSRPAAFKEKESWLSGFVGLIFGIASLSYIFSAQANGVTVAYILTQLNVVIATLGAVFILREKKNKTQMRLTYLGLILIVGASVITVFL
ncbi:GRP family sugar transporter [Streptococcus sp. DD13]|uniref:GRP family sugar transporter n=1 Tax=Streptococcus sp. DD13 TaxID=1777881 RepID=UPI00079178B8|nr:GRP family sugar transporter [Streptococcus sp. DD13]KXT77860.1 glucose uptake protein [Streptococcus sp. DD13]